MPENHEAETAQTVEVPIAPDWTWDSCIVCGSMLVVDRGWVLHRDGTLARVAWCSTNLCQDDHAKTPRVAPESAINMPTEEATDE